MNDLFCLLFDDQPCTFCRYSSFVRIGSGFSFMDYEWIRQLNWKDWKKTPPSFLQTAKIGAKTGDDIGDVYLEPEECVFSSLVAFFF